MVVCADVVRRWRTKESVLRSSIGVSIEVLEGGLGEERYRA
jgi:hypothetical protein